MPYATPGRIEDEKKILAELFSRLDQGDSLSTAIPPLYARLVNMDQGFSKRPRGGRRGTRGFAESRFTDQSSQFLKGLRILARPKIALRHPVAEFEIVGLRRDSDFQLYGRGIVSGRTVIAHPEQRPRCISASPR